MDHTLTYHYPKPDPEQGQEQEQEPRQPPPPKFANWILVIDGIHQFCGVQLYTTAWSIKEGGWCSLLLLFFYFVLTLVSCRYIELAISDNPSIVAYSDIGRLAFGLRGMWLVTVVLCLLSYTSSVESCVIAKDILASVYTGDFTILGYKMMHDRVIITITFLAMVVFVLVVPNLRKYDRWLAGAGFAMNILVVCCLWWMLLFGEEVQSSTGFVRISKWPISSGFFALCFSGHSWLPQMYRSLKEENDYAKVVHWIFAPSLFLYLAAAIAGYWKFGDNVEPIFLLSMPTQFYASWIAAHITVAHQLIRYIFGIYGVIQSLEQHIQIVDTTRFLAGYEPSCVRSVLVTVTIPCTLLIKHYGPTMALLGSILGIVVALIIPYLFITILRRQKMNGIQTVGSIAVVVIAFASLMAGIVGSVQDMINDK